MEKPVILCAPEPRSLELIFTVENLKVLQAGYQLIEVEQDDIANLSPDILAQVSYIIGQPSLSRATLAALVNLRCIFNVESNLLNNMPYDVLFERGIHVVTTGAVFAKPVAELGLGLALCLARNIVDADLDFRQGSEAWGGEGNQSARLLSGASIGLVGFGDLGKELVGVLGGFRAKIQVLTLGFRLRRSLNTGRHLPLWKMFSHRVTWYLWLHLSPLKICILLIKHGLRGCKKARISFY